MATHILVECAELIATVRVGVLQLLQPLQDQKQCEIRFCRAVDIKKEDICWCDIFICVRGCERLEYSLIEIFQSLDKYVLYYLDDDLLEVPESSGCAEFYQDESIRYFLRQCIKKSHRLIGVNPVLLEKYGTLTGVETVLTRAPFVINRPTLSENQSERIGILYAGSTDHKKIVQELLCPVFQRLHDAFGDKISIVVIGPEVTSEKPEWGTVLPFFECYEEYRRFVEENKFAIGLAPIYDTPFYHCKYYNKFLEYTSLGAVTIATDSNPYRQIMRNRENGFLCGNAVDEWYETISEALCNVELRNACLAAAYDIVEKQFAPQTVVRQLVKEIPELVTYRAPFKNPKDIHLPDTRLCFYLDRLRLLWNRYHFLCVFVVPFKAVKKVLKYFRRLLSD